MIVRRSSNAKDNNAKGKLLYYFNVKSDPNKLKTVFESESLVWMQRTSVVFKMWPSLFCPSPSPYPSGLMGASLLCSHLAHCSCQHIQILGSTLNPLLHLTPSSIHRRQTPQPEWLIVLCWDSPSTQHIVESLWNRTTVASPLQTGPKPCLSVPG